MILWIAFIKQKVDTLRTSGNYDSLLSVFELIAIGVFELLR